MENKKRILISVIGGLNIVAGIAFLGISVFFVGMGAMLLAGAGSIPVGIMSVIHGFKFVLGGVFVIVTGIGMIKLKKWAKLAAIMEAAFIILGAVYFYKAGLFR